MDENKNNLNGEQNTAAPEQPAVETAPQEPVSHAKKSKRKRMPTWLRVILMLVIIAAAVLVVLYLTAWIANFKSIGDLLTYIWDNVKELFGKTKANTPPSLS